ncbi:MAG TPA: SEC-C metal-binding domain-containing protein [Vicinamibacteria bacterium]|jgi:hypothetical protein|nr:SEC-C metal-binding domain-containing protein [Vicinamibacteria bacterium]
MSKVGRNDPCPCGSGKKFKRCHGGQTPSLGTPQKAQVPDSLYSRNLALLDAINDVFKLRSVAWTDIRRTLSADQVREVYRLLQWLWPPNTDLASLLPPSGEGLRGFYMGEPQPEYLPRSVFRFSLYCDDLVLINPFFSPLRATGVKSPLVSPAYYRADMLKLVFSMKLLEPWIRGRFVHLIPEPGFFDPAFDVKTIAFAKARVKNIVFTDEEQEEMAASVKEDVLRLMKRLPVTHRIAMIREYDSAMPPEEVQAVCDAMDRATAEDPFALDQPIEEKGGQMHVGRQGVNLETALYLCHLTGAFPYTNLRAVWRQIEGVADRVGEESHAWGSLTRAFGALRFRFLNDVDSRFAYSLREQQRLSAFRSFLRKIWGAVQGSRSAAEVDRLASDLESELRDEYRKSEAEWKDIDTELMKWLSTAGAAATTAVLGGLVTVGGGLVPAFAAGGFTIAGISQLFGAMRKREGFRRRVPMSVLLDLSKFTPGDRI